MTGTRVRKGPLSIDMSMYGGFEQVGSLGQDLTSNDTEMKTTAGDIVLYNDSQIVLFYGSNAWAYKKLGQVTSQSESDLERMLGNGDVSITLEMR